MLLNIGLFNIVMIKMELKNMIIVVLPSHGPISGSFFFVLLYSVLKIRHSIAKQESFINKDTSYWRCSTKTKHFGCLKMSTCFNTNRSAELYFSFAQFSTRAFPVDRASARDRTLISNLIIMPSGYNSLAVFHAPTVPSSLHVRNI